MDFTITLLTAVGAYLIGAISFPRLVAKLASPETDIAHVEIKSEKGDSLHPSAMGATTVSAALGWKVGMFASLLDMLKVFFPTLALRLIYPDQPYFLIFAFFGVVGNNWPVYYRFKGGWGVSAIYGGIFAVDPLGAVVSMVGSLVLGLLTRDFIVLFLSSLWILVPWLWFRTHDPAHLVYIVGVNLAMLVKLIPEMKTWLQHRDLARLEENGLAGQVPMGRGLIKMMKMLGMNKSR
jgi:glycerol-3-phosphate acyltransferase PlsY